MMTESNARGPRFDEQPANVDLGRVLQQVQHLRTHPVVAAKLATGKVEIHGWVYNIETGGIRCSAEAGHSFENFESRYQKEIAEIK